MAIEENDTHYQEIDTNKLFVDGNTIKFDAAVANLMKKNETLTEEVRNLKREQEFQSIFLCEVIEQKKKFIEDKVMIEDKKRTPVNILEEKTLEVQTIASM